MELDSDITAIVTGGVSGLGAAVVTALRERKVNVSVFDLGSDDSIIIPKTPMSTILIVMLPIKIVVYRHLRHLVNVLDKSGFL